MKIQCRLDYFFLSKSFQYLTSDVKIVSSILLDHSAVSTLICTDKKQYKRGPGFWKFNNSLLTDKSYVELITKSIPEYVTKYQDLEDIRIALGNDQNGNTSDNDHFCET